jgi:hypothetical protein
MGPRLKLQSLEEHMRIDAAGAIQSSPPNLQAILNLSKGDIYFCQQRCGSSKVCLIAE